MQKKALKFLLQFKNNLDDFYKTGKLINFIFNKLI